LARGTLGLGLTLLLAACGSDDPVRPDPPVIVTDVLADATVGVPYFTVIEVVGGSAPYTWSLESGLLPGGLTLDSTTGVIAGTPDGPGASAFLVRVSGSDGQSATRGFGLAVLDVGVVISAIPLPDGVLGRDYAALLQATGGDGTYQWTVTEGRLPPGLSQDGAAIEGTPTGAGYFGLEIQATSGGKTATAHHRIRVYETELAGALLGGLPAFIESALRQNQELLPRNPHLAEEIQAKVDLLSDPALEAIILDEPLYRESAAINRDGATIPVFITFPADTMEAGALKDLSRLAGTMAILEAFLDVTWPSPRIVEWYGFILGHGGGGGVLYMEDRGTYAGRGVAHDVILPHELGHSYVGNETLTQFLEVYGFNLYEAGSTEVEEWSWTRGDYVAFDPGNGAVHALLDIYQLLGPEAMGRAFAALHRMGVPYGSPLGAQARQTFVDEATAEVRDQVAELVERI
jgi:hypothetical protein